MHACTDGRLQATPDLYMILFYDRSTPTTRFLLRPPPPPSCVCVCVSLSASPPVSLTVPVSVRIVYEEEVYQSLPPPPTHTHTHTRARASTSTFLSIVLSLNPFLLAFLSSSQSHTRALSLSRMCRYKLGDAVSRVIVCGSDGNWSDNMQARCIATTTTTTSVTTTTTTTTTSDPWILVFRQKRCVYPNNQGDGADVGSSSTEDCFARWSEIGENKVDGQYKFKLKYPGEGEG
jgi:hypothetical protein